MTEPNKHKIIHLTDISAAELDDQCGMRYWLNQWEGGKGIIPVGMMMQDQVIAKSLEDLRMAGEMQSISKDAIDIVVNDILDALTPTQKADVGNMELLYRRLGWFAAYTYHIENDVRNTYDNIPIANDIILDRDPLWVAVKPGRLLKNRYTRHFVYQEFVPSTVINQKWRESWMYSPRLQVAMAAVQEETGYKIDYGQVVGLSKGFISNISHRLSHPYVYGRYNKTNGQWAYSYAETSGTHGWIDRPIWDYTGGLVQWIINCGEDVAMTQFPLSPKVGPNKNILDYWVERRLHRERSIHRVRDASHTNFHIRHIHFPMVTSKCIPVAEDECPYLHGCHNMKENTLLQSGLFVNNPNTITGIKETVA